MTVFYYTLKRMFKNVTNIVLLGVFPIVFIFMPSVEEWPPLPYGYQYFGILMLFIGIRFATMILEDRSKGLVKRLAVAPITHFQYLTQNILAFAVIMIVQCMILVGGGMLVGHELYQPLWLFILFISFSFTALALAVGWTTFFKKKDVAFLVYMCLIIVMAFMGGLIIPIQIFPDILAKTAYIFPTYWMAEGMHWIITGDDIGDMLLINAVLWLYTAVFIIIGSAKRLN